MWHQEEHLPSNKTGICFYFPGWSEGKNRDAVYVRTVEGEGMVSQQDAKATISYGFLSVLGWIGSKCCVSSRRREDPTVDLSLETRGLSWEDLGGLTDRTWACSIDILLSRFMNTVWLSGLFSVRHPSSPTRTNLKLQQIPGTVVCNSWIGMSVVGFLFLPSECCLWSSPALWHSQPTRNI